MRSWVQARANILVQAEEIVGIVFGFDLLEPPVVGSISSGYRISRLIVVQVVDVATRRKERLHALVSFPGPGDARARDGRLSPLGKHKEVVALTAVRKCRLRDADPGCRTVDVLKQQL